MTKSIAIARAATAALLFATCVQAQGAKPLKKCAPDAVVSGTVCMDKYEASVWQIPDPAGANAKIVKQVKAGKATQEELIAAGAFECRVAGRGRGHPGPGQRQPHYRLQYREPGPVPIRLTQQLCVDRRRLRHDRQRLGVHRRLAPGAVTMRLLELELCER